ncbi:MAG TPA: PAS domain-containing protein [Rhodospirillales bacterium]|nr:PAS domain-containing protein [Rhodospirillales bacterium]
MSITIEKILNNEAFNSSVLKGLADNSFDSILVTDASRDAKIIYANKAFKSLTGFSPADVIGKTPKILQGPATDKKVLARLAVALRKGIRFEGKAINYKKDRTPFIMYWRVVPAKIGKDTKVWIAIQREGSHI